jgi:hypothetical protein
MAVSVTDGIANAVVVEETILASAARTSSGNSGEVDVSNYIEALVFLKSGAGTGTSPTLDVKLQVSPNGSDWYDLPNGAFTQVTTSASSQVKQISNLGRRLRVAYTIGGTSPSFTFEVRLAGKNY